MAEEIYLQASDQLKIALGIQGDVVGIQFTGVINEDVNFSDLLSTIQGFQAKGAQLDLSGITRMNSCGVREWLLFLEHLQSQLPCRFSRLSECFIEQANLVPNMLGKKGAVVVSFDAPYFCSNCDSRVIRQIAASDMQAGGEAPGYNCDSCKKPLELDALEGEYFNFLKHVRA